MKKLISILLCLALLLSCAAALAETATETAAEATTEAATETATEAAAADKTELKVSDELSLKALIPEGYEMVDLTSDDQILYMFGSKDTSKPVLILSLGVDDSWPVGTKLNNISEEDLKEIEYAKFLTYDPTMEIYYTETAYGTKLLVASMADKSIVVFYCLYDGYEIEFDLLMPDGSELTQAHIDNCVKFLSDLDFVYADK